MNVKIGQLVPAGLGLFLLMIMAAGCGGSDQSTTTQPRGPLQSISIAPANASIAPGTTRQFSAMGTYANGSKAVLTSSVTWTSSYAAVSIISNTAGSKGLATAATATGQTIIAATYSGVTGSTLLTVSPVASLAVAPANPSSIAPGTSMQFAATGTLADSTVQTLTTWATWSSSDTTVATIIDKGLAHAMNPGPGNTKSATITAAYAGASGTATVTSSDLSSIAITPVSASIAKGTTQQFTAVGTLADATPQTLTTVATWTTSNIGVAAISNASGSQGRATAASEGTCTITSSFTGVTSGPATLHVTPAILSSLTVTPRNPSIALGKTKQFLAMGTYSDDSVQDVTSSVTWASTLTSVATISNTAGSKGLATSHNVGTTTIRATSGSISASTTLFVTPVVLESILVTPIAATIFKGAEKQFAATGIYTDGSMLDLTTEVTWHSSTAIATISNTSPRQGIAQANWFTNGTTFITATMSGITSNDALLTVN